MDCASLEELVVQLDQLLRAVTRSPESEKIANLQIAFVVRSSVLHISFYVCGIRACLYTVCSIRFWSIFVSR